MFFFVVASHQVSDYGIPIGNTVDGPTLENYIRTGDTDSENSDGERQREDYWYARAFDGHVSKPCLLGGAGTKRKKGEGEGKQNEVAEHIDAYVSHLSGNSTSTVVETIKNEMPHILGNASSATPNMFSEGLKRLNKKELDALNIAPNTSSHDKAPKIKNVAQVVFKKMFADISTAERHLRMSREVLNHAAELGLLAEFPKDGGEKISWEAFLKCVTDQMNERAVAAARLPTPTAGAGGDGDVPMDNAPSGSGGGGGGGGRGPGRPPKKTNTVG